MKNVIVGLGVTTLIFAMTGMANVYALDFGTDITISDKNFNTFGNPWYTNHEDQEVEPGLSTSQEWDLEGFFLNDTELTMVGGFNFQNGYGGQDSGDIFIDVDGDAVYGDIHKNKTKGNKTVKDTFGYDYVLDLDFSTLSYAVYELTDESTTITSYYKENQGSNPWRYNDGGIFIEEGSLTYQTGLSDGDVGFLGGFHNAVSVDLGFLGSDVDFTTHFTMECGNDNLMGKGVTPVIATPEPSTLILLSLGLVGVLGIARKHIF